MKLLQTITAAALLIAITVLASAVALAANVSGSVDSYSANAKLDFGTVVSLDGENNQQVKPATKEQMQNMFGVVVNPNQLAFVVSNDSTKNQTYVAASGTYKVLVSNENGAIASGDYLTMSSIEGVAMKAGSAKDQSTVLGRAQDNFNDKNASLGQAELKTADGQPIKTVNLGSVPATINIQSNPNKKSTEANLPDFLERLGQEIAQKQVSPIRIYISLAITAVSLITALVVIYTGVRSAIVSIGRNPLSKKSIYRALLEVILTSFLILIIGLFAVYLLLRL